MPAISMALIEDIGEQTLEIIQPEALREPTRIDFAEWAEHRLGDFKIFVSPASVQEMRGRLGVTDPTDRGDGVIEILMEASHYDDLLRGGRRAHQARGTVVHEVGHTILHVPVMRRRIIAGNTALLNRKVRRDAIKPYRDPEWQAWALGGVIAAPRRTILQAGTLDPDDLAEIFGMSSRFMELHLERLRLRRRERLGQALGGTMSF
jgi:hypothetical protein